MEVLQAWYMMESVRRGHVLGVLWDTYVEASVGGKRYTLTEARLPVYNVCSLSWFVNGAKALKLDSNDGGWVGRAYRLATSSV